MNLSDFLNLKNNQNDPSNNGNTLKPASLTTVGSPDEPYTDNKVTNTHPQLVRISLISILLISQTC
jgi:hypothetical protein